MRYILTCFLVLFAAAALHAQSMEFSSHKKRKPAPEYRNTLTLQVFGGAVVYANGNPTVGLDYEYIVSKKLHMGIHIPVVFGYAGPDQELNGDYQHTLFYTAPGIRFHVSGNNRDVDFSTGPSFVIGNQHFKPNNNNQYYYSSYSYAAYNRDFTGIAADNAIDIKRRNFVFGFNARVGYTFAKYNDSRYFMDLGIHFGGRFL